MYIAVDFDGTCVSHEYPYVGHEIGAIQVLKRIQDSGHEIILNTMRSGNELVDAVQWFVDNNITLLGINENPTQKSWTDSPKVYAHLYIDDAALGCPLKMDPNVSGRPFVDWYQIEKYMEECHII